MRCWEAQPVNAGPGFSSRPTPATSSCEGTSCRLPSVGGEPRAETRGSPPASTSRPYKVRGENARLQPPASTRATTSAGPGRPRWTAKRQFLGHGNADAPQAPAMPLPGTHPQELHAGPHPGTCAWRQVNSVAEAQRQKQPQGPEMSRYTKYVLCIL